MSRQELELHPDYRALLEENTLLREELARLLAEEHELIHLLKPHLLALYQQKLGGWELRALEAQVAAARSRRTLEMAQAAVNQGRSPSLPEIVGNVEREFAAWQRKVAEAAQRITAADERLRDLLPAEESQELKTLYRSLVKRLHPDINPGSTEEQRRLWHRVQAAYVQGDLPEMRALDVLAQHGRETPVAPAALEVLKEEGVKVRKQIHTLLAKLEALTGEPPFSLRGQLQDDAWLAARRSEIENEIARWNAQSATLGGALRALLHSADHGKQFGPN